MAQEIEIEEKMLLSEEKFTELLSALDFPDKPFIQTNYYFETPDLALKNNLCALRIRKKGSHYIMTLKEPHRDGILETHDTLTSEDLKRAKNNINIDAPNCAKQLALKQIDISQIIYFGSLTTERYEFEKNQLIYVLDKSSYNNMIDYELEIEAPSRSLGVDTINHLIKRFNIPRVETISKIQRFFKTR